MTSEIIKYEVRDHVAEIILARPKKFNALSSDLREKLHVYLTKVEESSTIRVVVLRGEGPGFCAGADLTEPMGSPISKQLEEEYKPIFKKIVLGKKLYISAVHGSAAGIGAALALVCDFMVMAASARISLIFSNINLIPDGGLTWLLLNSAGRRKALEIIVEGKHISADDCLQWGITNRMVDDEHLVLHTQEWATQLALRAPLASSEAKKLLRMRDNHNYWQAFDDEGDSQDRLSQTKDFKNAVVAFLEKKKPIFEGK